MSAQNESTQELVSRASRGSLPEIEALLERFLPELRAYIRLRSGPAVRARESASDLAQSVCREILGHLDRFQYGDEVGFKRWLYATALRRIQNKQKYHTAQKRDLGREIPMPAAASRELLGSYKNFASPSENAMANEELSRIEQAFDQLTEEAREVITLARVVGLSHAEIAQQIGSTAGATRVLLHRSLAKLARLLDAEQAEG